MNVVLSKIQEDWNSLLSKYEVEILHKYGRKCNIYIKLFVGKYLWFFKYRVKFDSLWFSVSAKVEIPAPKKNQGQPKFHCYLILHASPKIFHL